MRIPAWIVRSFNNLNLIESTCFLEQRAQVSEEVGRPVLCYQMGAVYSNRTCPNFGVDLPDFWWGHTVSSLLFSLWYVKI